MPTQQSRIGWFVTALIAIPIVLFFLPVNVELVTHTIRSSPYLLIHPSVFLWLFLIVQTLTVFIIARLIAKPISKRICACRMQLHLSTCIILMLVASVLVYLNLARNLVAPQHQIAGWPFSEWVPWPRQADWAFHVRLFGWNFLFGSGVLAAVSFACERFARMKERPIPPFDANPNAPPSESTITPLVPTRREVWLYALPMFGLFALLTLSPLFFLGYEIAFKQARVELPLASRTVIRYNAFALANPWAPALLMGVCFWFYFNRVVKSRKRMILFATIVILSLLFGLMWLAFAAFIPFSVMANFRCVAEGTPIETPDGPCSIEELKIGEKLITVSASGEIETASVTRIDSAVVESSLLLKLENGAELRLTGEHPVAQRETWTRAALLRVGAEIRCRNGFSRIVSIEEIARPVRVFDMTVAPNANFFANGVLVHNALKKK